VNLVYGKTIHDVEADAANLARELAEMRRDRDDWRLTSIMLVVFLIFFLAVQLWSSIV